MALTINNADYSNTKDVYTNVFKNVSKIENCNFEGACLLHKPYACPTSYDTGIVSTIDINNSSFKCFNFTQDLYYSDRNKFEFKYISFRNCNFDYTRFKHMEFKNCLFENINFKSVLLEKTSFIGCTFTNVNFEGLMVDNTPHEKLFFTECKFINVTGYSKFFDVRFTRCEFDAMSINTFKTFNHGQLFLSQSDLNVKFHDKNKVFTDDDFMKGKRIFTKPFDVKPEAKCNENKVEDSIGYIQNFLMGGNKENRTVFIVMCIAIFLLMLASPFISLPCNSNRTKAVIPVVQSNQVDNIKPPTDEEIKEIIKSEPPRLNQEYNIEGDNNTINIYNQTSKEST